MIKLKKRKIQKKRYEKLDGIINKSIRKIKPINNFTAKYEIKENNNIPFINESMDVLDISDLYDQQYNFDNDNDILDSFSKVYKEHDMKYETKR